MISMASFDNFIASLQSEFGVFGKGMPFEVFCKWFLENDPVWSKRVQRVWRWEDYPEKWQRKDLGTDLVFHDTDGKVWAVQCKCYDEKYSTTKADVNSFLADTGRKQVSYRLWMQTTNKMASNAITALKGQEKPVTIIKLDDFRDASLTYPNSFSKIKSVKQKKRPTPDPHQRKAINDVVRKFKKYDKGRLIMACGTGKTFTTLWIKEKLKARKTLVLVPSLNLLSQTMREWAKAANTPFEILSVCSDKSVAHEKEDMKHREAAFPVTSSVNDVAEFLRRDCSGVVFCTYQSTDIVVQAQRKRNVPSFDLAVADEAHRCTGNASKEFSSIVDEKKIKAFKRLFTTATPRYFGSSVRASAKSREIELLSMNDEAAFGPEFHTLTFGQAIQDGLLNDYQVVVVGVTGNQIKEWIEEKELFSIDDNKVSDARSLAAQLGLLRAIKKYNLERVISFHGRVSRAKEFSADLPSLLKLLKKRRRPAGNFFADYVSGDMKTSERREKIKQLEALETFDRGLLSNARCLAEGVNVPVLDCVAFIDPKGSQVEIIQAVGRAIRKVRGAKEQKPGTIVVPVFLEEGDDADDVIERSDFQPVWSVVKAMRAHDEVLAEMLDNFRTNMGRGKRVTGNFGGKIVFDLPAGLPNGFAQSLNAQTVEATTESWSFWYGLLQNFHDDYGHARVEVTYKTVGGKRLGTWCDTQRVKYRNNLLEPDRVACLERLLGWTWSLKDSQREMNIKRLTDFFNREGHSVMARTHREKDGFALGFIAQGLRNSYFAGKLEDHWVRYLEDKLFFIWDIEKYLWLYQYKALRRWCFKNKRSVPPKELRIEIPIGPKATITRSIEQFRNRHLSMYKYWQLGERDNRAVPPKEMTEREILAFEKIPYWTWDSREAAYREFIEMARSFLETNNASKINKDVVHNGYKLGAKLVKIRSRKDIVPDFVLDFLVSAGVDLNPFETKWQEMFELLLSYVSEFKSAHVKQSARYKGEPLGSWVSTQRTNYKAGRLSKERITKLEAVNGWLWDASDMSASSISKSGRSPKKLAKSKAE